jgi:molybdate transport system substrate-binding protein
VIANYPIAKLKQSSHSEVAQAFIDFILSDEGQAVMAKYGFLPL